MCLYPKVIKNRKYLANKKNGGVIPPVPDERVMYVPVGCQECMECRKQKAREWQVRLLEDIRHNRNGKFITLTFSDESIREIKEKLDEETEVELEGYELDNAIAKYALRHFLENWRKKHKKSLRHWLVTELGGEGTENIHMHGIVWTDDMKEVEAKWKYGMIWKGYDDGKGGYINYVNERTVSYMTKYVSKMDEKHKGYRSRILTSPGIGKGYTDRSDSKHNKYNGEKTIETYRTKSGHKISMPVYWRNKIYSEKEREQLWLQKLDKGERWVNGERISIKNGEENYYKLLEWHRETNRRLGYGNGEITWEREQYERERRKIMYKKRLEREEKKGLQPEVLAQDIGCGEKPPQQPTAKRLTIADAKRIAKEFGYNGEIDYI